MTTEQNGRFQEVSRDAKYEICSAEKWCGRSGDGKFAICRHESKGAIKKKTDTNGSLYYVHLLVDDRPPLPPKADSPTCNSVYVDLLKNLPLSPHHCENLLKRGLTEDAISSNRYGTLPANRSKRAAIAKSLEQRHGRDVLLSVPGFFVNEYGDVTINGAPGLLVPARNSDSNVVALKVRKDKPGKSGKYSSISAKKKGGHGPGAQVHVPSSTRVPSRVVRVTEGELKADAAACLSGFTTISVPGVSIWRPVIPVLKELGAEIVRLAFDSDCYSNPIVAKALRDFAKALQADGFEVELETWNPEDGKGIDDLLTSGKKPRLSSGDEARSEIDKIAQAAGVNIEDDEDETNEAKKPGKGADKVVRNFSIVPGEPGEDPSYIPISMFEILGKIAKATCNWPRRVGSALFIDDGDLAWILNVAAFIGWLGSRCGYPPEFQKGVGFHTPAEVFEEAKRVSLEYDDVETLPHYPPLKRVYYLWSDVTPGDGATLNELIARFNPETPIDRDLILAMFVSPGWGGAGNRPAFGITSEDGRGSGKTTLAKMVGKVWGGRIEVSPEESVEIIKQRLLSPDAMTKRVVNIDNLKSMKFSNAGLEALITSDIISGKRLYHGEAQRPNNLTWITTLNGVSFATDMAQRSVTIKIKRPTYSGNWQDETEEFIERNRDAIIADCIGFLMGPAEYPLEKFTRWGNWERDVLSRLPDPNEAQRVIMERQGEADAEGEESSDFEDAVRQKLFEAGYSPEKDVVFVSSKLVAEWLSEVTGERFGTTKASRTINQRIDEGRLPRIIRNPRNGKKRGFVWIGEHSDISASPNPDLQIRLDEIKRQKYRSF